MSQSSVLVAAPPADRPTEEKPKARDEKPQAAKPRERVALSVRTIWLAVTLLAIMTWVVGRSGIYTPDSDPGYYLGLVGALMMISLLLYPVRKYLRSFRTFGDIRRWFQVHMILGVTGPVLILLHSTYQIRSFNAGLAFYTMLIVAGSGIVGRFMYAKIHRGLYGRRATLEELKATLGVSEGEVKSRFRSAPRVEMELRTFTEYALASHERLLVNAWRFATLRFRSWRVRLACRREIRHTLGRHALIREWSPGKFARRRRAAMVQVGTYLDTVVDVTQFHTYERMFALWHVLHVPLVYGLAFTAIFHVIAVHMY